MPFYLSISFNIFCHKYVRNFVINKVVLARVCCFLDLTSNQIRFHENSCLIDRTRKSQCNSNNNDCLEIFSIYLGMYQISSSDAAIRKMLATLGDPFTRFLEPDKFNSLRVSKPFCLWGLGALFYLQ